MITPSIMDTSILLSGALTAAEYFKDEAQVLFEELYSRDNWQKYYDEDRNLFYMGYQEDTGGFGQWDMYAEQLMQYILGVVPPTFPVPPGFVRMVTMGQFPLAGLSAR